jgi:hypothetical protein
MLSVKFYLWFCSVFMLSVIMLSVIVLNVVEPFEEQLVNAKALKPIVNTASFESIVAKCNQN